MGSSKPKGKVAYPACEATRKQIWKALPPRSRAVARSIQDVGALYFASERYDLALWRLYCLSVSPALAGGSFGLEKSVHDTRDRAKPWELMRARYYWKQGLCYCGCRQKARGFVPSQTYEHERTFRHRFCRVVLCEERIGDLDERLLRLALKAFPGIYTREERKLYNAVKTHQENQSKAEN